mgnify:CR=1 FL=1
MRILIRLSFLPLLLPAVAASASSYKLPGNGQDVVGQTKHIKSKASDTFVKLSRKYDIGFRAMEYANPKVDPWLPGNGTSITLPTRYVLPDAPHQGIVINRSEMRVYYYPPKGSKHAGEVFTFPIGVGRKGWQTPQGKTHVVRKIRHPSWTVPASIRKEHAKRNNPLPKVVPAGPNNPLGQYALRLAIPGYLMHGTNKPRGIGMQVSHGCIRLYPKDIKQLFNMVSVHTPVDIVDQPYKAGWNGHQIVLSAHPPINRKQSKKRPYKQWPKVIVQESVKHPKAKIDWKRARAIVKQANGIPQPISGLGDQHNNNQKKAPKQTNGGPSTADTQFPKKPRLSHEKQLAHNQSSAKPAANRPKFLSN